MLHQPRRDKHPYWKSTLVLKDSSNSSKIDSYRIKNNKDSKGLTKLVIYFTIFQWDVIIVSSYATLLAISLSLAGILMVWITCQPKHYALLLKL